MKNKKACRIIALAMCIIMLLCFVACGANGGADSFFEDGKNQSPDSIILGDGNGMSSGTQLEGGIPTPPKAPGYEPIPEPIPFPYPDYEEVVVIVTPTEDNKVSEGGIVLANSDGSFVAYIAEGTLLNEGVNTLKLTLSSIENSSAELVLTNTEESNPIDVHIEGVSPDNKVPIKVYVSELLPKGLNMGNYRFYHVQNGETVEMNLLADGSEAVHNNYEYDPLTGDVNLYIASFSEIAVVADTTNAWNGEVANGFAGGNGTEEDPYLIANADQLAYFNQVVSNDNENYGAKHYKLVSNLNFGGSENAEGNGNVFYPIGYLAKGEGTNKAGEEWYTFGGAVSGTFDGNGNTISGIYQNTWIMDGDYDNGYWDAAMGLFGYVYGGTVKNLTVDSFSSDGEFTPTGVISAYAVKATFENISLTNCNPRVYNTGNGGIVGIGGNSTDTNEYTLTFKNITIDQTNKISALWGSYDVACGGIIGMFRGNGNVNFKNCHVSAIMDVNNDVCGNYQYYWYRYAGMFIGSIRGKNITKDGYTVADTTGITATDCTYEIGDWNAYWYCELVANSLASYTHDHQFSRLEKINAVTDIQDENGNWNMAGNFVIPNADNTSATCYHIVKVGDSYLEHKHDGTGAADTEFSAYENFDVNGDGELNDLKEDRTCYFIPFNQLMTGDGWGVKAVYAPGEIEGFGATEKSDGTVKSYKKFESTGISNIVTGSTITIGELFNLIADESMLSKTSVFAFVSPVGENSTASATYAIDVYNWENGSLTFSGLGNAKIVITDYYYCEETVINVTITEPAKVDKFVANDNLSYYHTLENGTIVKNLGDIFEAIQGVEIDSENVVVTVDNEICTYEQNADWTKTTLAFTGTGTVTITITDNNLCNVETATVTIANPEESDKFNVTFPNVDKYLYRVGNANTITLGTLFTAELPEGAEAKIDFEIVSGNAVGTYTSNGTWTNGTIKFSGTGVAKITIDSNAFTNAVTLTVEVVDAVNATSATNAISNNVVLLKDVGFSSLDVEGGYTLYGNGFTLTCGSDSYASDLGYAFVTLDNGTLDNVQIVCPNFDYAALYKSNLTSGENRSDVDASGKTRYYNAKSGVMVSGNSQILNSRISGARAAVNVSGGNLIIDNSRIEGGAVANILVGSANSLTLKDITLIQKPEVSTYDANKALMGFSVLYMCDSSGNATPTVLEGSFVQQAWIDEDDKKYVPTDGQSIVTAVLKETDYKHDIDGDGINESLNLGFAYMGEEPTSTVSKPENITDNRTDKATIPYEMKDVKITLIIVQTTVYVYSYKNTNETDSSFITESTYAPNKQGDVITVTYSDAADGLEAGKSFSVSGWVYELNVDLDKLSGYAVDFSKVAITVNGVVVTDYLVNGESKPTSPIAVTAGGKTYKLTAIIDGVEYTIDYKVTGTETSKESPSLVASNYATGLCVASSSGGTWHGAAPALEGIQIRYWSVAEQQYKTINLADYTPTTKGQLNGTNTTWTYSPANGDFTLTLTGGQVHSSNSVYAMPVVVENEGENTLYFVAASSKGLVNSGNGARTIPVSYLFKDNNNGDALTFSYTWSVAENQNEQYKYSDFCNGTLTKLGEGSGSSTTCLTPDTLITLADGTQVRVDSLTGNEELLVWNLETGKLDKADIMFVDSDSEAEYEIVKLIFSDGTEVKVIYEHGFWDYDLNKYVYLDRNASEYIGHYFAKQNGDKLEKVQLTDVLVEKAVTTAWSPVTKGHLCYFVNGMLSMPGGVGGLFNIFEVDNDTMTYDYEAMERDIEKYGLYTYEELNAICPLSEEMFEEAGGAYLKVSIGKGNLTVEELINMITRYSVYFE